ncbi:MAG: hypothetical protein JWO72_2546 [Caulobacteraceae bacterium]|nr:hypothetical protein [Caulobacteraceae bacterium]
MNRTDRAILRPDIFLVLLLSVDFVLLLVDATLTHLRGHAPNLFDLNGEANIPTWWSSAQLLVSGSLIALVALRNRSRDHRSWSLAAFAGLVILMSVDETACFHERLGALVDSFLDRTGDVLPKTGYWPFAVGLPAAAFTVWIAAMCASFFAEAKPSAARFFFSLIVFFGGAVGVELLNNVRSDALRYLMIELEEALEMTGGSLLAWSALGLIRRHPTTADAWNRLWSPDA